MYWKLKVKSTARGQEEIKEDVDSWFKICQSPSIGAVVETSAGVML